MLLDFRIGHFSSYDRNDRVIRGGGVHAAIRAGEPCWHCPDEQARAERNGVDELDAQNRA